MGESIERGRRRVDASNGTSRRGNDDVRAIGKYGALYGVRDFLRDICGTDGFCAEAREGLGNRVYLIGKLSCRDENEG